MKRDVAPLVCDGVTLTLLEESDLPTTLAWRNQPEVRHWFLDSSIISPERHREWFRGYRNRDDDFLFVIHDRRTLNRPVGQVGLYRIDWDKRRAEFGRMMIGDLQAQGRGVATAATQCLIRWAFTVLQLKELYLEVLPGNQAARRLYDRCGFTEVDASSDRVNMRLVRPD